MCTHSALYSSLAQSVERMTVNHDVAGSSPAGGAREKQVERLAFFMTIRKLFEILFSILWSRTCDFIETT